MNISLSFPFVWIHSLTCMFLRLSSFPSPSSHLLNFSFHIETKVCFFCETVELDRRNFSCKFFAFDLMNCNNSLASVSRYAVHPLHILPQLVFSHELLSTVITHKILEFRVPLHVNFQFIFVCKDIFAENAMHSTFGAIHEGCISHVWLRMCCAFT